MSEDGAGNTSLPARFRKAVTGNPPGRHRKLRRATIAGVPAIMAVAGAIPAFMNSTSSGQSAPLPSRILCGSWQKCDGHGYDSYHYGAHEYTPYWRMSPGDQCTNYAAFVEAAVYRARTPSFLLGNGGQWAYSAATHGVTVNHSPSVGAVAEWDPGSVGMGGYGHVAVVEEVGPGDKYIVISQQHMGGVADYNWTRINRYNPTGQWQTWPSNFIHFRIPRRADIGFYNSRTGAYSLRYSQTRGPANRTGRVPLAGAVPLTGDWTGSGLDSVGFYNPRYGTFHLPGAGAGGRTILTMLGTPRLKPLAGDWKGSGRDGIGFYDPKTGTFGLRQSQKAGPPDVKFIFGRPGMIPLAGDWNGDGRDGVGYYNPRTGIFNLRNSLSHGPAWVSFRFGPPHMVPVAGNWSGTGRRDSVGYYDPKTGMFYLRDRLSTGPATTVAKFGPAGMVPLAGQWFGA